MTTIDPLKDELLTIAEAAKRLASRPCTMSVFRWLKSGKLAGIKIGAKWFTTPAALEEFVRGCNPTSATGTPPPSPAALKRRASKAGKQLKELEEKLATA